MLKYGGQGAAPSFREIVDRVLANPDYPLARMARPAGAPEASSASATTARLPALASASLASSTPGAPSAPAAAAPVARVSAPSAPGSMPDLMEHTLRDALFMIKDLGLDVEYSGAGRVIRQEPPAGAPVKAGRKCVLTLGWTG